jgi:hypothetical protein
VAGDDDRDANQSDPDRAAILARRRRFIALAISGLATAGCKNPGPQVCLSRMPESAEPEPPEPEPATTDPAEPTAPGPFVEDPGAPLENDETGGEATETGGDLAEPVRPEVCLKIAAPPQPCLKMRPKTKPHPCLLMID